jgi:hypothetical protein
MSISVYNKEWEIEQIHMAIAYLEQMLHDQGAGMSNRKWIETTARLEELWRQIEELESEQEKN